MELSSRQKSLIERVVNCFETGRPDGDYGSIAIFADGPHDIRQITYGRSQTTEYGNLRKLVGLYVDANGIQSDALRPYVEKIGSVPLVEDAEFKGLLRLAGRNDPIMREIQDSFFDENYFVPAMKWADAQQFTLALSALVIYDSYIHSGSILWIIRQRFTENPPALGGSEQAWITAYVRERQRWLGQSPRPAVRATTYRTKDLQREIARNNWDLAQTPILAAKISVLPSV